MHNFVAIFVAPRNDQTLAASPNACELLLQLFIQFIKLQDEPYFEMYLSLDELLLKSRPFFCVAMRVSDTSIRLFIPHVGLFAMDAHCPRCLWKKTIYFILISCSNQLWLVFQTVAINSFVLLARLVSYLHFQ